MHYSMHKIRPEEALQSNLTSCYGKDVDIIPKMIKEVILNEYNMASSLNLLLQKLEKNMISYEKR